MPLKYKKPDPATAKLIDQVEKESATFDRWFRRLMRAARALDKSMRKIKRLNRKIHAPKQASR